MIRIFKNIKSKPLLFTTLSISAVLFLMCAVWTIPAFITSALNFSSISIADIILGLILPLSFLAGIFITVVKSSSAEKTASVILRMLMIIAFLVIIELLYTVAADTLPAFIYSIIDGSILTAKIMIKILMPIIKLPFYALLLCMLETVLTYNKNLCMYTMRHFFAYLAVCLLIFCLTTLLSLLGLAVAASVVFCLLTGIFVAVSMLRAEAHQWGGKIINVFN